jgi:hypothetical protein
MAKSFQIKSYYTGLSKKTHLVIVSIDYKYTKFFEFKAKSNIKKS